MDCRNCIYCNVDYIWCDEAQEELETALCDKGRAEFMTDNKCSLYTEYPPYKERATKCDKCSNLNACAKNGKLMETTLYLDTYRHYIPGLDGCPKGVE